MTDRTFYRHFKDKSEVLFGDEGRIERLMVDAVTASESSAAGALRDALHALAQDFEPRRAETVRRATVVEAIPDLAERELWKVRTWAQALTHALIEHGENAFAARAQVEVALALFRTAFHRWTQDDNPPSLDRLVQDAYTAIGLHC